MRFAFQFASTGVYRVDRRRQKRMSKEKETDKLDSGWSFEFSSSRNKTIFSSLRLVCFCARSLWARSEQQKSAQKALDNYELPELGEWSNVTSLRVELMKHSWSRADCKLECTSENSIRLFSMKLSISSRLEPLPSSFRLRQASTTTEQQGGSERQTSGEDAFLDLRRKVNDLRSDISCMIQTWNVSWNFQFSLDSRRSRFLFPRNVRLTIETLISFSIRSTFFSRRPLTALRVRIIGDGSEKLNANCCDFLSRRFLLRDLNLKTLFFSSLCALASETTTSCDRRVFVWSLTSFVCTKLQFCCAFAIIVAR